MTLSQANAINEIAQALAGNNDRIMFNKAAVGSQVAGYYCSHWRTGGGVPSGGAIPTAAAYCTSALQGAVIFTNQTAPMTSYLAWHNINTGLAGANFEIFDRLAHMGGLNGTLLTAQTVGIDLTTINAGGAVPAARLGAADFSDVLWFLEWYTTTGSTASNATVNVTYNDGTTGNLAVIAIGGTAIAAQQCRALISNSAGKWIRGVNTVTLSASTGTAGNFGVTAARARCAMASAMVNKIEVYDWAMLGIPEIPNDSCLYGMAFQTSGVTSPAVIGQGKIIHV